MGLVTLRYTALCVLHYLPGYSKEDCGWEYTGPDAWQRGEDHAGVAKSNRKASKEGPHHPVRVIGVPE